jgi:cytoskeleton protein RodZ
MIAILRKAIENESCSGKSGAVPVACQARPHSRFDAPQQGARLSGRRKTPGDQALSWGSSQCRTFRRTAPLTHAGPGGIDAALKSGPLSPCRSGDDRRTALAAATKDSSGVEAIEPGAHRTGVVLAKAREAAGIDLADLARDTRIPLRHLKAIEADSHASLPALPYTIGFVKTFAKAVGLDPEAVATQFRGETSKLAHVPSLPSLEPLDERRLPSRGLVGTSLAVIALIIAGLSAWGAGLFDPALPTTPVVAEAAPPAPATAPDVAAPAADIGVAAPAATPVAAATGAPALAAPAAGPVVLTANEDVWIKIYDRTTRTSAKIGILKAGESFAVPTDPPGLQLWTGKAGALTVTVNGKPIPPLGGPVQTVRDVSLAPADLLARAAPPPAPATPGGVAPVAARPGA